MAGNASWTINATAILGNSSSQLNENSVVSINGVNRTDMIQQVSTTGGVLSVAPCGSVSLLIVKVLSSDTDPNATVTIYRDSGMTQALASTIPQNTVGLVLLNPPPIYAKASTASVSVRLFAVEQ
jgi:hypothetical protein